MGIRIAICQIAGTSDPEENLKRIEGAIMQNQADLYVFPELYLTGYGNSEFDPEDTVIAENRLRIICNNMDVAVVVGAPMQWYNGITDSMLFITPLETYRYDKMYTANFPPYDESMFERGHSPAMVEWKGMRIGLEICYDVMFPEIHRFYATQGADMVIVISASSDSSKAAMERIVPARSLENTVYTIYCNNVGPFRDGAEFFGGSALYSPLGDEIAKARNGEEILITYADKGVVEHARTVRPQLRDLRGDIRWIL